MSNGWTIAAHWDRYRLEQVLIDLFSNASKYGKGKPVRIEVKSTNGMAVILIRDQGIGIAKKDQERIFQQFVRAVSENNVGGMGLGLYIAGQIVEAHGGSIRVQQPLVLT